MAGPLVKIRVDGADELRRLADVAGSSGAADALQEGHKQAAKILAKRARQLVPVKSGTLKGTIKAKATKREGTVTFGGPAAPYGPAIHFGWPRRGIVGQPFVFDAMADKARDIYELYEDLYFDVADELMTT